MNFGVVHGGRLGPYDCLLACRDAIAHSLHTKLHIDCYQIATAIDMLGETTRG